MGETITQEDIAYGVGYALAVAAGVGMLTRHEWKSVKYKHSFCSLLLLSMVVAEFYFVSLVAVKLTPQSIHSVLRSDCRASVKGGKISKTFRDCTQGQGSLCSRETPCTPCDYPLPPFEFDGVLWESSCAECGLTSFDKCAFKEKEGPYCLELPSQRVQGCKACCSNVVDMLRQKGLNYSSRECEQVYEEEFFPNATKALSCDANASFPVRTRFGCCPESAAQGEKEFVFIGNADQRLPTCLFRGPNGASWESCGDEAGCPLYSNGVFVENYCLLS